jgi:hypothetical protein
MTFLLGFQYRKSSNPDCASPENTMWSALAKRSDDSAFVGRVSPDTLSESLVALRLPPHSNYQSVVTS